jgi:hypothetical protein
LRFDGRLDSLIELREAVAELLVLADDEVDGVGPDVFELEGCDEPVLGHLGATFDVAFLRELVQLLARAVLVRRLGGGGHGEPFGSG